MLVVVKKPHIEIKGKAIPAWIIGGLRESYGKDLTITDDNENELIDIYESAWYKGMKETRTPGKVLAAYRFRNGLTLKQLGDMLDLTPQKVNDMEKDNRGISKEMAKKLADIFKTSPARFI